MRFVDLQQRQERANVSAHDQRNHLIKSQGIDLSNQRYQEQIFSQYEATEEHEFAQRVLSEERQSRQHYDGVNVATSQATKFNVKHKEEALTVKQ